MRVLTEKHTYWGKTEISDSTEDVGWDQNPSTDRGQVQGLQTNPKHISKAQIQTRQADRSGLQIRSRVWVRYTGLIKVQVRAGESGNGRELQTCSGKGEDRCDWSELINELRPVVREVQLERSSEPNIISAGSDLETTSTWFQLHEDLWFDMILPDEVKSLQLSCMCRPTLSFVCMLQIHSSTTSSGSPGQRLVNTTNQPITQQQMDAFRHVDVVETTHCSSKWAWVWEDRGDLSDPGLWRGCWYQMVWVSHKLLICDIQMIRIWLKQYESMDPSCHVSTVDGGGVFVWGIFSWPTLSSLIPTDQGWNTTT